MTAGDRTFEQAPQLARISAEEQGLIAVEFKALAGLRTIVKIDKLLEFRLNYGNHLGVGLSRFALALKEYFDGLEAEGELDDDTAAAREWLRQMDKWNTYRTLRSYLRQEGNEAIIQNASADEIEGLTAEEDRTIEEYPAFSALADLLEDRLLEAEVDEIEALDISAGTLLGGIVVREVIEMEQLFQQLAYVTEG